MALSIKRRLLILFAVALTAANIALVYQEWYGYAANKDSVAFPAFSVVPLPGLESNAPTFTQEDLSGNEPVVVNIFASWCGPCIIEHPLLTELTEEVRIIGINYMDRPEAARAFLNRLGNPYDMIAVDRWGELERLMGVNTLPRTYVIASGRIQYERRGRLRRDDLDRTVLPLVRKLRSGTE